MVRVCEDTLQAKGKNKAGLYLDPVLKDNLDILIKNAMEDWDFVIIVSGGGRVRVGKSLLALQIAYYWNYQLKKLYGIDNPLDVKNNIVFKGSELISKGNYLGKNLPHSAIIFDEAGADLEGVKAQRRTTQDVKDFLRECGQYNLLTILVLPEYFDLPKGIALSRSDCLIDVFTLADRDGMFERGFFNFYSRPAKKMLYLKGKKELNYKAHKYDFHGRYYNNYPIDEQDYRQAKAQALKDREMDKVKEKHLLQRNALFEFCVSKGYTQTELAEFLQIKGFSITQQAIAEALNTSTRHQNNDKIVYEIDNEEEETDGLD